MSGSTAFGSKKPIRPQAGVEKGGVLGEIADLRNDIDEAFQTLESVSASSFPTIDMLDGEQPLDLAGADLMIRGAKLLNGGVAASLAKAAHGLTFYACKPGTGGNALTVQLISGIATGVAYVAGALALTFNAGVDDDDALATAVNAAGSAARGYIRAVSAGTVNAAGIVAAGAFAATALTGGLGTDWACRVSGAAALPVQLAGTAPAAPVTETACLVRVPDLTALTPARTSADANAVFVTANGVRSNPAFLRSTARSLSTIIHVDAGYTGTDAEGTPEKPYAAIQDGIDAASAGDVVLVGPGAYVEDLVLVDGVHLKAILPGTVTVTGSALATDVGCVISGIDFIDDGAGVALTFTGTAAETLRLIDCNVTSTATGAEAFVADNPNGTVIGRNTTITANAANANEAARIDSGTGSFSRCSFIHGNTALEALVCEGQDASSVTLRYCDVSGQIGQEAAVVAPTLIVEHCVLAVGAISAVLVAALCSLRIHASQVTSSEAADEAFGGAGTVQHSGLAFPGSAAGFAATLTVTTIPESESVTLEPTHHYVDGNHTGEEYGTRELPFSTIAGANAVAVAGDVVYVRAGAYIEDVVAVTGVTYIAEGFGRGYAVQIIGALTCLDVNANFEGFQFVDDNATGTDAVAVSQVGMGMFSVQFKDCMFLATGAGLAALHILGVTQLVTLNDCMLMTNVINANPVIQIESGLVNGYDCVVTHGSNVAESLVAEGVMATTTNWFNTYFTGQVGSEAAVANPTMRLVDCEIDVGAVAGLAVAAGNTVRLLDVKIDSTEADGYAISGSGTVEISGGCVFSSTARGFDPDLTVTELMTARMATRTISDPGSVAVVELTQAGQPNPGDTLVVGGDIYTAIAPGPVAPMQFVIDGGGAAVTFANLLAAVTFTGLGGPTENLFWDEVVASTTLRARSADAPQGNVISAVPNIALSALLLTNYAFDCGDVNMSTLAGRAPAVIQTASASLTINADHITATRARISFPFAVARFEVSIITAGGVPKSGGADVFTIANGDVLISGLGAAGAPDIVATDIVNVTAYSA